MPQDVFPPILVSGEPRASLVRSCQLIYLLYGIGIFLHGIPSLFGMPPWALVVYLLGGAMAYMRREDAIGTWAESHIRLMIKMFWVTILFSILTTIFIFGGIIGAVGAIFTGSFAAGILMIPLILSAFLLGLGYVLWFGYWNLKGWLRLNDRRAV